MPPNTGQRLFTNFTNAILYSIYATEPVDYIDIAVNRSATSSKPANTEPLVGVLATSIDADDRESVAIAVILDRFVRKRADFIEQRRQLGQHLPGRPRDIYEPDRRPIDGAPTTSDTPVGWLRARSAVTAMPGRQWARP